MSSGRMGLWFEDEMNQLDARRMRRRVPTIHVTYRREAAHTLN